jgi:curli production assembly/transport component CsgG|tara:strand:- start:5988 stop:6803 length:816 start_codon:yes stop_codon:yes gene_type:complete
LVPLLSSCALLFDPIENNIGPIERIEEAQVEQIVLTELANVRSATTKKPVVAVYADGFKDDTGQRRSNSSFATFSTAVTQAPYVYLIRALKHAGTNENGFFEVVERVGLDHVTKERQLIRSTRQEFDEKNKLPALLFAGLIIEGGVVGYESNIESGGAGARHLGIGGSKEYRRDTVSVSLRVVSVATGKVLLDVLVTKTILSASVSQDVFRFISTGTELVEIESGRVRNESINLALRAAIETAVLEVIKEGENAGFWRLEDEKEQEQEPSS